MPTQRQILIKRTVRVSRRVFNRLSARGKELKRQSRAHHSCPRERYFCPPSKRSSVLLLGQFFGRNISHYPVSTGGSFSSKRIRGRTSVTKYVVSPSISR